MYNFSSIHSFVCECTISVGGLPVNYTSAEHDMRRTQKKQPPWGSSNGEQQDR